MTEIDQALSHHRAGQLQQAEAIYRQILRSQPDHPDALHLLGVVALQAGRNDTAVKYIEHALQGNPRSAEYHYNLGLALSAQGRVANAEVHFRKAIELKPDYAQAHNNLANTLEEQGKVEAAIAHYRNALRFQPGNAAAHTNLANVLKTRGQDDEAIAHYQKALVLDPSSADARYNLGNALRVLGRVEEAVDEYKKAIALNPRLADAHYNLGLALRELEQLDAAVESYENALRINPDLADVHNNLGNALAKLKRQEEAIVHYQNALAIDATYAKAHYNLGNVLRDLNRYVRATESFRRAVEIEPQFAEAHANLGITLREHGLLDEALASFRRSLVIRPDPIAHSGLIFTMHSHPRFDAAAILAEARRWNACYVQPLALRTPTYPNDRSPDRRLKIGYLSTDFKRHPVGYLFAPVLAAHNKRKFEIICYSGVEGRDDLTEEFAAHSDHWRDVVDITDDALAEMIREDSIDVIVDLAGHTKGNRLLTLARKPAPIRVCGGGHYGVTGVDGVQYLLSDRFHTPPGSDAYYSEQLICLPDDYICYRPPPDTPPVAKLPALGRGHVVFGCYNNLSKITANVIRVWTEILTCVPDSKIRLQTHALNDSATRDRIRGLFESHGIDGSRVELEGPVSHIELLDNYRVIDIALDPFPYSGGLTTCEALWMGVPVITVRGGTFAGRHSTSHLSNVGFERLVTETETDYIAAATRLACDLNGLATIRQSLRTKMAASPLCDGERYTRNLEVAFRKIWTKWCEAS